MVTASEFLMDTKGVNVFVNFYPGCVVIFLLGFLMIHNHFTLIIIMVICSTGELTLTTVNAYNFEPSNIARTLNSNQISPVIFNM